MGSAIDRPRLSLKYAIVVDRNRAVKAMTAQGRDLLALGKPANPANGPQEECGTNAWPSACVAKGHNSVSRIAAARTRQIGGGPKLPRERPPFGVGESRNRIWSGRRGSNPRPSAWEADAPALTLMQLRKRPNLGSHHPLGGSEPNSVASPSGSQPSHNVALIQAAPQP